MGVDLEISIMTSPTTVIPRPTGHKTAPKADVAVRPQRQPPYVIVIENDDKHTFAYVIEVLRRICGHSNPKAFQLTNQIHTAGKSAVWSGTLELAELKRDQIRGFGPDYYAASTVRFPLAVTIEPLASS